MKSVCWFVLTAVVAVASIAWLNVGTAQARKQYSDEFIKKYVTEDPSTPAQKALDAEVKAVKCGVCHAGDKGANKKERNAYGAALQKAVGKNEKNASAIDAALDKVADEHSVPGKDDSPTFGDLLKEGKLPVK